MPVVSISGSTVRGDPLHGGEMLPRGGGEAGGRERNLSADSLEDDNGAHILGLDVLMAT